MEHGVPKPELGNEVRSFPWSVFRSRRCKSRAEPALQLSLRFAKDVILSSEFDSVLIVSFGGPEGPDDVLPFLENVLRGKSVPQQRMLEVVQHYQQFGGVSPINSQNRALIEALRQELDLHGINLPIYWGNRNWHPMLPDTLRQMAVDGRKRAIAFFTSMFSSYSGCRQYRENIIAARETIGADAPVIEKVRMGFNHPSFVEVQIAVTQDALQLLNASQRDQAKLLFTAHSIPTAMADRCQYQSQLRETARSVCAVLGRSDWELVFQSRSGPPHQPWLEPDICARIEQLASNNVPAIVIIPVGFVSDHIEVLFDLDTQAVQLCQQLNLACVRAKTAGTHPAFVTMIRQLIEERLAPSLPRPTVGIFPACPDICPEDCCLPR